VRLLWRERNRTHQWDSYSRNALYDIWPGRVLVGSTSVGTRTSTGVGRVLCRGEGSSLTRSYIILLSLSLEHAGVGLRFLFTPEWSQLGNAGLWLSALVQVWLVWGMAPEGSLFSLILWFVLHRTPGIRAPRVVCSSPLRRT
jgi:hypothetical protein